jgi:hypothetical protein
LPAHSIFPVSICNGDVLSAEGEMSAYRSTTGC